MRKIVPFKKEIVFKTNISEITSISLEHNLHIENDNLITGNFIISGSYKIADSSVNTEVFNYELPFDINVDEKYLLDNIVIDIDDFYYEIVNNKSLEVNIEVLIDKLEEKTLVISKKIEEVKDEEISDLTNENNILEEIEEDGQIMERCIEKEDILSEFDILDNDLMEQKKELKIEPIELKNENKNSVKINSLFDNLDSSIETYKTYKVCIIRNGDSIENVLQKYSISREELEKYNNLSEIKIGDKLIIPAISDEKI